MSELPKTKVTIHNANTVSGVCPSRGLMTEAVHDPFEQDPEDALYEEDPSDPEDSELFDDPEDMDLDEDDGDDYPEDEEDEW